MSATTIKEKDLVLPAVMLLAATDGNKLDTAGMVTGLSRAFGLDTVPSHFDRAVRNLKSHRTLAKGGLAYVTGKNNQYYRLTRKGKDVAALLGKMSPAAAHALVG
jgi:hypothetical protein